MTARAHALASSLALALAGATVAPSVTLADPAPRATRSGRVSRPTRRAAPAPAPTVPVQIAGLRPGADRTWASVLHAIRRDAGPWLSYCAATLSPRGVVRVTLAPEGRRWGVSEVSGPVRDARVTECVRRAAARVVVPPSEVIPVIPPAESAEPAEASAAEPEPAPDTVSFEVAFSMPRLGRR
ncbi:MAG: hypothetical protein R3A52_31410 [Polyangiales bacterium]